MMLTELQQQKYAISILSLFKLPAKVKWIFNILARSILFTERELKGADSTISQVGKNDEQLKSLKCQICVPNLLFFRKSEFLT